jgi:hypothetical protein
MTVERSSGFPRRDEDGNAVGGTTEVEYTWKIH